MKIIDLGLLILAAGFIYGLSLLFGCLGALVLVIFEDEGRRGWRNGLEHLDMGDFFRLLPFALTPTIGPVWYLTKVRELCRYRQVGEAWGRQSDPVDFPF